AIIRSTKTLDKNSISIAAMGLESEGSSISHDELLARIQQALIEIACSVLSINFEDIDIDIELNEYGFDSVTLTSFIKQLNESYRLELIPTILYEHSTIGKLSHHFAHAYPSAFFAEESHPGLSAPVINDNEL